MVLLTRAGTTNSRSGHLLPPGERRHKHPNHTLIGCVICLVAWMLGRPGCKLAGIQGQPRSGFVFVFKTCGMDDSCHP